MKKIYKNSFTLFEVLVSLIVLSIVISSISKLTIDNDTTEIYYELQTLENSFISSGVVNQTENIKIVSY